MCTWFDLLIKLITEKLLNPLLARLCKRIYKVARVFEKILHPLIITLNKDIAYVGKSMKFSIYVEDFTQIERFKAPKRLDMIH